MAKYKTIAGQLEKKIEEGCYPELKLPTEDVLMKEFETSRNTIRNAIDLLVGYGKLYRIQGSGVYIREIEHDNVINTNAIRGISSEFAGHITQTKLLDFELVLSDEEIARKLKMPVGEPVYYIKRLRYVDERPLIIEYCYYNKNVIPYLGTEIANGSIYEYIEKDLKLKIGFADKYISAAKLNSEDAELFHLNAGDPALVINEKVYLSNGTLFNSSRVLHNYQYAELFSAAKN